MTSPTPFQLLPRLSDGEYDSLRDDIRENGIRVPIDVDEEGTVLDGHHRSWIAAELGVQVPRRIVTGLDIQGKRNHARAVNVIRRHLTKDARLDQVKQMREEGQTIQAISTTLGIPSSTVGRDLGQLSQMGKLDAPAVVTGVDGKERPATYKTGETSKVSFKDTDLDFLNAPAESFNFGLIEGNRESVGPAEIRSAVAYLTTGNTRLENVGKEAGSITTWFDGETQESREQIACIVIPPAVKAMLVLSVLIREAGLRDTFHTMTDTERVHTMEVLSKTVDALNMAHGVLQRLNDN